MYTKEELLGPLFRYDSFDTISVSDSFLEDVTFQETAADSLHYKDIVEKKKRLGRKTKIQKCLATFRSKVKKRFEDLKKIKIKGEAQGKKIYPRTSTPVISGLMFRKESKHLQETSNAVRDPAIKSSVASLSTDPVQSCKMHLIEGRVKLQELKTDVASIRSDIGTAQKMFASIEKSIQDYKWERMDREVWKDFSPQMTTSYLPTEMVSDHRIFVEQMKFHFRWNHGIII